MILGKISICNKIIFNKIDFVIVNTYTLVMHGHFKIQPESYEFYIVILK